MPDFLNDIYGGNTIRSYLIVAGVILLMLLIKRFVAVYLARLTVYIIKRSGGQLNGNYLIEFVAKPLGLFLAVFISISALFTLNFPEELNIKIYKLSLQQLLHGLSSMIIIILLIRLLMKLVDFINLIISKRARHLHDVSDTQLIVFFKDFIKAVLIVIGVIMVLKYSFNYPINNLLTGISIVGAAIALSLKESLENLIASIVIFFDKPFRTGDSVKGGGFSGTIEKIGLRSTRIRTDQKTFLTVPNKQMVDSIVDNTSNRTQRKAELKLEIGLSANKEEMEQVIAGIKKILENEKRIVATTVFLSDITPSAYLVTVDYFTDAVVTVAAFNIIRQDVNLQLIQLLETLQLSIAGASSDIVITQAGQ